MGVARIRKIVTVVEETQTEMGRAIDPPTRKAAAVAVTDSGRPLPRVGGLTTDEIMGDDGLR